MFAFKQTVSICVLILVLYNISQSQISGFVFDKQTGDPLTGANVWINQTTCGESSAVDGSFLMPCSITGEQELVVSYIGYHVWKKKIDASIEADIAIYLEQQALELSEVTIISENPKKRKRYIKRFEKNFLGFTSNAKQCIIQNPEVLQFEVIGDDLKVFANTPINIQNSALGYTQIFLLENALIRDESIQYQGKVLFRPMSNQKLADKWKKNRKKTLQGSTRHFFQSLIADQTKNEGYQIYHSLPSNDGMQRIGKAIPSKMINQPDPSIDKYTLSFEGYLEVVYTKEKAISLNQKLGAGSLSGLGRPAEKDMMMQERDRVEASGDYQTSWIKINGRVLSLNHLGTVLESNALQEFGYWSNERIADMLPFEYGMQKQ